MTLTPEQIEAMATLDGEQQAELTRLRLRHANELGALFEAHARQREGLGRRLGLPLQGAPGTTGGDRLEAAVVPGSSAPALVRAAGGRDGRKG